MENYDINKISEIKLKEIENDNKGNNQDQNNHCKCIVDVICEICKQHSDKLINYLTIQKVPYKNISFILPNIYLGNDKASGDKKLLEDLGITHVLVCGGKLKIHFQKDYNYYQLPINSLVDLKY